MSLAGSTHALCRSLISIHSFLKCSSIHLERMLWLTHRVERISLNERWQRPTLWQHNLFYRKWLQNSVSLFYCFDWVLASTLTQILPPPTSDHISNQSIFSPHLTGFVMSHPSYQYTSLHIDTDLSSMYISSKSPLSCFTTSLWSFDYLDI